MSRIRCVRVYLDIEYGVTPGEYLTKEESREIQAMPTLEFVRWALMDTDANDLEFGLISDTLKGGPDAPAQGTPSSELSKT